MLNYLLFFISVIKCSDVEYVQTLVFGNNNGSHYCDVQLTPHAGISNVTIFRVIDGDQDRAVPCCTIEPQLLPAPSKFHRIEIPDNLVKDGQEYSFQFELYSGRELYSESWTLDSDKNVFAVSSSITKKFWKDKTFLAVAGIVLVLACMGSTSYFYRRIKKSRDSL